MSVKSIAVLAAAALVGSALFADSDLNVFIHGGSTVRPLAATTASAEGYFDVALDAASQSSDSAMLSAFDSWWRFVMGGLLDGKFNSTVPGLLIILR